MLIPWGFFAQEIGLIRGMQAVPIPQRTRDHAPQAKVLELFAAIQWGLEPPVGSAYLQDISLGPNPLDQDQAVARAWCQERWAATWLSQNSTTTSEALQRIQADAGAGQASVKQSVRIAANTTAQVTWQSQGCLLRFTELGPLADAVLAVRTAGAFQLALPLFKSRIPAPT
jgi:hypothetical protein